LVDALLKEGHEVHAYDDLSSGSRKNLPQYAFFHEVDIARDSLDFADYDQIYHLACAKSFYCVENPIHDLEVNALGALRVLEAAKDSDADIFHASSGTIYGVPEVLPTPETWRPKPMRQYGVSKYAAEMYCRMYADLYGMRVVIGRLHSVYGPRQGKTAPIPKFYKQISGGQPVTVEGDGLQRRAFTYIKDCVNGIQRVMASGTETYNVASGLPHTVLDIVHHMHDIMGREQSIQFIPRRPADLDVTFPDVSRLKALGWEAEYTLREGLEETIEAMQNE
jgi:UDP-glucose 4-epimerase